MTVQAMHLYPNRANEVCFALIDATCLPNSAFFSTSFLLLTPCAICTARQKKKLLTLEGRFGMK